MLADTECAAIAADLLPAWVCRLAEMLMLAQEQDRERWEVHSARLRHLRPFQFLHFRHAYPARVPDRTACCGLQNVSFKFHNGMRRNRWRSMPSS